MNDSTSWMIGLLALAVSSVLSSCAPLERGEVEVLVFSGTAGYRHASIEAGVEAIRRLGEEHGFVVLHTEDAGDITEERLREVSAVVFLSTTGDILDPAREADLQRFIQAGGGFVGIHAAADTEHDWRWYGDLVGGYFERHPPPQEADVRVVDGTHRSTEMLPATWTRFDEWYDYRDLRDGLNVLLELDESSYEGGAMGDPHPIAWYHEHDGGRAWYTGLGHTEASYSEDLFLQHVLEGIRYAIGDDDLDYSRASTHRLPDPTRFRRSVLASNLDEPMELDMLPDGRILLVERKGDVKLYDPVEDTLRTVAHLPVHTEFEDGLLGLAVDPGYAENHWIYLFYSSLDGPRQHVARFVFEGDTLDRASERVLLEIPVQRQECCHSAGSLEFGPDGLLYISTGDDTNPFGTDYAPIDERPGREPWDAQRTSANTNDLRGKILRIRPEDDGSYGIPEGNLFEPGIEGTRPEIYAMGLRNPFRMTIDRRRNWLIWGDVGPDAGEDDPERGPKGLDGINLARAAGFWGWPYSRGDNRAYHDYDFATDEAGPAFDPARPINDSPNNTGLSELPPARSSVIWYSYDESEEFPWVGTGGKNPMAGPVYYVDDYPAATRLPDYFDGKLLVYDWMRHWFHTVELDSAGIFVKADPLMAEIDFVRPMDVIVGGDGRLYILEYGRLWFTRNLDARLSRIDYVRGNRAPRAVLTVDRPVGAAPLDVELSATESRDLDGDVLEHRWWVGEERLDAVTSTVAHTFELPGVYTVRLEVRDPDGETAVTETEVQVGNEPPDVSWQIEGNRSFYWDGRAIPYQVSVGDREDGRLGEAGFDDGRVEISFAYLPQGATVTPGAPGQADLVPASRLERGRELVEGSDCRSCHAQDEAVNGPSYRDVAARYREAPEAETILAGKILNGGSGEWGETAMAPHPQLTESQAREMVRYVLSLGTAPTMVERTDEPRGVFVPEEHLRQEGRGAYVLTATYTDRGAGEIGPLTARDVVVLRHVRMEAEDADERSPGLETTSSDGTELLAGFGTGDLLRFDDLDLTGMTAVRLRVATRGPTGDGAFAVFGGSVGGEPLGSASVPTSGADLHLIEIPLERAPGRADLIFVYRGEGATAGDVAVDWVELVPEAPGAVTSRQAR